MSTLETPEKTSEQAHTRPATPSTTTHHQQTLRQCVETSLQNYLCRLDGFPPANIYDMVIAEVESPLLTTIMQHTKGNQSKAARILGISRGTLRKKLKIYDLE